MVYRQAARLMAMSDETWRRHANPWSGWTRVATFPVLFLTVWSWPWIGWWACLPVAVGAAWLLLNPRLFPPPADDRAWMTRGVLGERVFLDRQVHPVSAEHARVAHLLTCGSGLSLLGAVVGFWLPAFWLALGGWLLAVVFKLWFVDRMVWLYEDAKAAGQPTPVQLGVALAQSGAQADRHTENQAANADRT